RTRASINLRARDISRAYPDIISAIDTADAELTTLRPLAAGRAGADSAVTAVATRIATIRQRARGNSIVSGIGRVFDLTAAIESSSMPPTDAQRRSIDAAVAEYTELTTMVNGLLTDMLP